MPRVEATVDVLVDLSRKVYRGELRNLHIRRYKTGENAGKLFAEYSMRETPRFDHVSIQQRTVVSDILKRAAQALSDNREISLFVKKRSTVEEKYNHYLAVKQNA